MVQTMKKLNKNRRGQGMTEYVIVVALIAIATIGIVTLFGDNIRALFSASSTALTGASVTSTDAVAGTKESGKHNLGNFGDQK